MRIDLPTSPPLGNAGQPKDRPNDGGRWQAHLQMALMERWPEAAEVTAKRGDDQHQAVASAQPSNEEEASRSCGLTASRPLARGAANFSLNSPAIESASAVEQPTASEAVLAWTPPPVLQSANGRSGAALVPACTPATADTPDADSLPVPEQSATAGQLATPRRYSKQLLQLSLAGEPQANLRDATLDSNATALVAASIARELHAQGVILRRIFINGQRFDASSLAYANTFSELPPLPQKEQE